MVTLNEVVSESKWVHHFFLFHVRVACDLLLYHIKRVELNKPLDHAHRKTPLFFAQAPFQSKKKISSPFQTPPNEFFWCINNFGGEDTGPL